MGLSGGKKKGVYLGRVGGSLEGVYDYIIELCFMHCEILKE